MKKSEKQIGEVNRQHCRWTGIGSSFKSLWCQPPLEVKFSNKWHCILSAFYPWVTVSQSIHAKGIFKGFLIQLAASFNAVLISSVSLKGLERFIQCLFNSFRVLPLYICLWISRLCKKNSFSLTLLFSRLQNICFQDREFSVWHL